MKHPIVFVILASFLSLTSFAFSQDLSVEALDMPLSKDAKKAAKKGNLTFMGSYWSADQSEMYSFFLYEPKNAPLMMDIFTLNSEGEISGPETKPFTAENLAEYQLEPAAEIEEDAMPPLAGKSVGYLKGPILAGAPTLNRGKLVNRYTNGLWSGYEFEEDDDMKLDVKFWPFFSYSLGGDDVSNDNYQLAKINNLGRVLQGKRTYIPLDGKALVGGQKAVSGANVFYVGVYNLATNEWESSQDIAFSGEISPGFKHSIRESNGNIHCAVSVVGGVHLLSFDAAGALTSNTKLSFPAAKQEASFDMYLQDGAVIVAGATGSQGGRGGSGPSIAVSKVIDGEEVLYLEASHAEMEASLVEVPRCKAKFNRLGMVMMDRFVSLPNGGYMLFFAGASRGEAPNYAAQFSADGELSACYQADPVAGDVVPPINGIGHQAPTVEIVGDKLYWLMRTVPNGLQKGIYFDSEYTDMGTLSRTTVTTMRVDESYSMGSLAVIDLGQNTISKQEMIEEVLLGVNPMRILPNGNAVINAMTDKGDRMSIFVK